MTGGPTLATSCQLISPPPTSTATTTTTAAAAAASCELEKRPRRARCDTQRFLLAFRFVGPTGACPAWPRRDWCPGTAFISPVLSPRRLLVTSLLRSRPHTRRKKWSAMRAQSARKWAPRPKAVASAPPHVRVYAQRRFQGAGGRAQLRLNRAEGDSKIIIPLPALRAQSFALHSSAPKLPHQHSSLAANQDIREKQIARTQTVFSPPPACIQQRGAFSLLSQFVVGVPFGVPTLPLC